MLACFLFNWVWGGHWPLMCMSKYKLDSTCRTARNPHAPERYTGGSSSGPAAIVASGLCSAALGTDGGGCEFYNSSYLYTKISHYIGAIKIGLSFYRFSPYSILSVWCSGTEINIWKDWYEWVRLWISLCSFTSFC